jgi:hypothetical protein
MTASLERTGLTYAYNAPEAGKAPGRIIFVPAAQVKRRLGSP